VVEDWQQSSKAHSHDCREHLRFGNPRPGEEDFFWGESSWNYSIKRIEGQSLVVHSADWFVQGQAT